MSLVALEILSNANLHGSVIFENSLHQQFARERLPFAQDRLSRWNYSLHTLSHLAISAAVQNITFLQCLFHIGNQSGPHRKASVEQEKIVP